MSLSNGLFAAVSGLDTTSTAISVIGDNIANVNTPGFKQRRAEFADVLGQTLNTAGGFSQTGAGSKLARVGQIFSQGTFESSARTTDMAIEGRGFFVLNGPQGRFYTRAGLFNFDNQGALVDKEGLRVQGFGIDPVTRLPVGQIGDIQLTQGVSPPNPSSLVDISVNLDSGATPPPTPFDPSKPSATSNFQTAVTLFDSLGNGVSSNLYFTNTGPGSWTWTTTLAPGDTTTAPATPGDPVVVQGGGTLTFDSQGNLTGATGTNVTYQFAGGAAPGQTVAFNFGPIAGVGTGTPTTQFADSSAVNSTFTDGFAPGTLQAISVDKDGIITGSFSNGESLPLAQIALATFPNVNGLNSVGNSNFLESRQSGQSLIGAPRSGQFGSIRASSIEQSNVDMAEQFVKLIISQRAFQANTRTVSVTNELLANVVQLGQ